MRKYLIIIPLLIILLFTGCYLDEGEREGGISSRVIYDGKIMAFTANYISYDANTDDIEGQILYFVDIEEGTYRTYYVPYGYGNLYWYSQHLGFVSNTINNVYYITAEKAFKYDKSQKEFEEVAGTLFENKEFLRVSPDEQEYIYDDYHDNYAHYYNAGTGENKLLNVGKCLTDDYEISISWDYGKLAYFKDSLIIEDFINDTVEKVELSGDIWDVKWFGQDIFVKYKSYKTFVMHLKNNNGWYLYETIDSKYFNVANNSTYWEIEYPLKEDDVRLIHIYDDNDLLIKTIRIDMGEI